MNDVNGYLKIIRPQTGGLFIARIKPMLCVGCDECLSACKYGVFKKAAEGKVEVHHPNRCKGCLDCLRVCLTKAIHILPGRGIGRTR